MRLPADGHWVRIGNCMCCAAPRRYHSALRWHWHQFRVWLAS